MPTGTTLTAEKTVPKFSSGRMLRLEQIESPVLRQVTGYWQKLRGTRRFPARSDITPSGLRNALRNIMLVRVIDGGADYEYRIVGDVPVQAYGFSFLNMRLSEIRQKHQKFCDGLRLLYEGVRLGGDPFGYHGWIGRDMPDTKYVYHESAFFPLGATDKAVDHILIAGVYVPRAGAKSR